MGYTTNFKGALNFNKALDANLLAYINTFSSTRRMKRDVGKLWELYTGQHGNPTAQNVYGTEGEYFAKNDGNYGQINDASVIDHNEPPQTQPGLWCQWIVTDDGTQLEWDGNEKFYHYVEWLQYLIVNFFQPWGYELNGTIEWRGENFSDSGTITVTNNEVKTEES